MGGRERERGRHLFLFLLGNSFSGESGFFSLSVFYALLLAAVERFLRFPAASWGASLEKVGR